MVGIVSPVREVPLLDSAHGFERGQDVHGKMGIRGDVAKDSGDLEFVSLVPGAVHDRAADGVRASEKPPCLPFGKEDGERVFQDRGLVAADKREGEDIEDLRVGPMNVFFDERHPPDVDKILPRPVDPDGRPDFRKIPNHGRGHRGGGHGKQIGPEIGVARLFLDDPVDVLGLGMVAVIAELGPDEEHDEDEHGHAHGQPQDVERGISLALLDVPPGDDEVILEHVETPTEKTD